MDPRQLFIGLLALRSYGWRGEGRIGTRLVTAVALLLFAASLAAAAQSANLARVGVLSGTTQPTSPRGGALLAGLRDFGYVDGRNIAIEWRASGGRAERLPDLAAELLRLNVDIIVAFDNPAIVAAQKATKTTPIVMVLSTDPVATGFITSLARPGGNITGLTTQSSELQVKALQFLKEALPTASRMAVLWDHSEQARRALAKEAELAAGALGLQAQLLGVGSAAELDGAFTAMARGQSEAVLIHGSQMIFAERGRIAALAAKRRLPTMGWSADTVEAGWLMSYGPNIIGLFRRAGYYVDKIVRGTKPADLPVEQPSKFELVINLKTAKTLGLTIPPSLLVRADQLIE